jgi:tRNA threonylcarbamoyladenosine biosynthesis protein TsaB
MGAKAGAPFGYLGGLVVMLILGIESATHRVGCAIGGHEGVIALHEVTGGRRHAETLTPAIEFICQQADVTLAELGCIAVDIGPGLFTGMRVGIATAKALAHALRVPMVGIASLDLLAFPLRHTDRTIVAVIDARRGEIYHSLYRQAPGGIQRLTEPAVGTTEDLISELMVVRDDLLLVGDGALRYRDQFVSELPKAAFADAWLAHPSAAPLVQLAHAQALREQFVNPWELDPLYLRQPDAEINWMTRQGRHR